MRGRYVVNAACTTMANIDVLNALGKHIRVCDFKQRREKAEQEGFGSIEHEKTLSIRWCSIGARSHRQRPTAGNGANKASMRERGSSDRSLPGRARCA